MTFNPSVPNLKVTNSPPLDSPVPNVDRDVDRNVDDTDRQLDELLVPLFVQARQEALIEYVSIPPHRSGVVTSTPTKVAHLVKKAEAAIKSLITQARQQAIVECLEAVSKVEAVNYSNGRYNACAELRTALTELKDGSHE